MGRWTIDQLVRVLEQTLRERVPAAQLSARIREVPDRRTVRYYTTLGLIDRPAEMRGRTAYYGTRHLLQLLAIKSLQAAGVPLADIQRKLAGATDAALAEAAGLSVEVVDALSLGVPEPSSPELVAPCPAARNVAFWQAEPTVSDPQSASEVVPEVAVQLRIGRGAMLTLQGVRLEQLDLSTWEKLTPALKHLSQTLAELKLTEAGPGGEPPSPNGPSPGHVC